MKQISINNYFYVNNWPLDPDKPSIVYVHPAFMSAPVYENQIKGMPGFNAIAPDLPGHGHNPGSGKDSISAYADCVFELISELKIVKPVLCGMSMGGAVCLNLLINHGELFKAAILINTGAKLKVIPFIFETIENNFENFTGLFAKFGVSPETDIDSISGQLKNSSEKTTRETAIGDFNACNNFDVMNQLKNIDAPVLIITAEHDNMTPPKYGSFLNDNIKNSKIELIKDAGHLAIIEKPDAVNSIIIKFINELYE